MKTIVYTIAAFILGFGCQKIRENELRLKCWDSSSMTLVKFTPDYAEISGGLIQFADVNGFNRFAIEDCEVVYGSKL